MVWPTLGSRTAEEQNRTAAANGPARCAAPCPSCCTWASAHRGKWGQLTPWKNGQKIKKRKHAKKQKRAFFHYSRLHHFVVKFSTFSAKYFLHLSLSSVILIDSSTGSPVNVLMLSIQAVRGLPCLRAPGTVPCIISDCCTHNGVLWCGSNWTKSPGAATCNSAVGTLSLTCGRLLSSIRSHVRRYAER